MKGDGIPLTPASPHYRRVKTYFTSVLGLERERREIRVPVVVVLVLGAFQESDDAVSHGRGDYFPAALEGVLGEHDGDEVRLRHAAVEGDEIENHRVHKLAAQGGADDPGPQPASIGPDLHLREHVAVHESSAQKGEH